MHEECRESNVIIKRKENTDRTFSICIGLIRWSFSSYFNYFSIADSDAFQVLTRGNFELVRRDELQQLQSANIVEAQRNGPPIVSEG
jgi:hypothetical protein